MTDPTDYSLDGFIAQATWTVAATYADTSPHQYASRAKAADPDYFSWFAQQTRDRGYSAKFGGKHTYRYLELGGWRYWIMWGHGRGATVINRCPTSQPREPIGRAS